jgi:DUF438 domain-containing protein
MATADQSHLNALKLIHKNKGERKLRTFIKKKGIKTLGDISKMIKNEKCRKLVKREMRLLQKEEDICQKQRGG